MFNVRCELSVLPINKHTSSISAVAAAVPLQACRGAAHVARRRLQTFSEVSSGVKKTKRPTKERREDQISKVNPPENEDVTTIQQLQLDKCLANKDLYSKPCSLLSNNIVLRS